MIDSPTKSIPLHADDVTSAVGGASGALTHLLPNTVGGSQVMDGQQLSDFLTEVRAVYESPEGFLRQLDASYPTGSAKAKRGR